MAPETQTQKQPSPALVFDTFNAYQRTQALKAGIELELFTAIGEGNTTAKAIAERCRASERGTRILCDFLTVAGFLTKQDNNYSLTADSATFLDKRSPAYMGTVSEFILSDHIKDKFDRLTDAVRKGGSVAEDEAFQPDHPMWVKFARAMQPMVETPLRMSLSRGNVREGLPTGANERKIGRAPSSLFGGDAAPRSNSSQQ